MWYTSSSGRIELRITRAEAAQGSHVGECDQSIHELRQVPRIRRQLAKLDAKVLAAELKEFGAWDAKELANHDANIDRILWIACGDINEDWQRK
jgi:hypothetical protein